MIYEIEISLLFSLSSLLLKEEKDFYFKILRFLTDLFHLDSFYILVWGKTH